MTKNDFPIDDDGNPITVEGNDPELKQVEVNRQAYLAAERKRWQERKKK